MDTKRNAAINVPDVDADVMLCPVCQLPGFQNFRHARICFYCNHSEEK